MLYVFDFSCGLFANLKQSQGTFGFVNTGDINNSAHCMESMIAINKVVSAGMKSLFNNKMKESCKCVRKTSCLHDITFLRLLHFKLSSEMSLRLGVCQQSTIYESKVGELR